MRRFINATVIVALLAACSNTEVLAPAPAVPQKYTAIVALGLNTSMPVRISEFHYDNVGNDNTEWIEISGPANTNLQGYKIELYDGATGLSYGTRFLGGTIPLMCNGRGVVLHMLPLNLLQDGPDGMALVSPTNAVIEFISYEGSFTAVNGPATGITSADIGVSENGTGSANPVTSVWRNGASTVWSGPSQNTFGTCNDQIDPPPAASVDLNPPSATVVAGATQQFTAVAYNASQQPIVNAMFSWTSSNPSVATVSATGRATGVAPGDAMIIASTENGKADTSQVHVTVASVEMTPATASVAVYATQQFTGVAFNVAHQPIAATISWRSSNVSIATVNSSGLATGVAPGDVMIIATADDKADTTQVHVVPPPVVSVEVTPSSATIIVGVTQQFTGVAFDALHLPIPSASISWSSIDASIATVSASGLATGVVPGDVVITASAEGKSGTAQLHVNRKQASSVEVTPSWASIIVGTTRQFTAVAFDESHQPIANVPISWSSSDASIASVSASGLATGVAPGDVMIIATADGKTATPQLHVNRKPAASVEVTPSSASIIVGATRQFTGVALDAAHQPIADATISWSSNNASIATVSASGLATGVAPGDVLIIASAEGKADTAQLHVDPANHPPTARVNGPFTGLEASPVSMSGASSSDPDAGDVLSYAWTFGDGTSGAGANVSHTYTQDGVYNVQLKVTDSQGLTSTVATTATVGNVAPVIYAFAGGMLLPGETYSASGSFSDPGVDSWTATVDYGDGSGIASLALSGKAFSLSHAYTSPGTFTVTVRVSDDDVTSSRAQTVTVSTVGKGVSDALALLAQLVAAGKIDQPNANPVREALEGALAKLADDKIDLVVSQLETALKHLDAAVAVGKISAADADPLKSQILRVMQSLGFSGFSSQSKGKRRG